jgi:hypothetical protein
MSYWILLITDRIQELPLLCRYIKLGAAFKLLYKSFRTSWGSKAKKTEKDSERLLSAKYRRLVSIPCPVLIPFANDSIS